MTQVTFYLLDQNGPDAEHFACRLIDKVWRGGLPVHIHTASETNCKAIDQLLWQWREESFIPHAIIGTDYPAETSVTIGHTAPDIEQRRLLINLDPKVPFFFKDFTRICEIVVQHPDLKELSRAKFRAYRQAGITPETHNMTARAP